MIAGGRNIVQVHIGRHEVAGALLFGGMERRKVDVAEELLGNVGGVVVAAALGCAVSGEMLDADEDGVGAKLVALESANLRARHGRAEVGVFAGAFNDASPAGVAGDVDHGRESPADAGSAGVLRGEVLGLFFDARVPGRRHGERHGKHGAVAVDDVERKQDRDVQAGLLDCDVLEAVDLLHIGQPEDRADAALSYEVIRLLRASIGMTMPEDWLSWPDLLIEVHLAGAGVEHAVRLRRG